MTEPFTIAGARAQEVSVALAAILGEQLEGWGAGYDVAVRAEQQSSSGAFGLAIDITTGGAVYPLWLTPEDPIVRHGVARGTLGDEVLRAIADCARRALRRKVREQEIDDDPVRALRLQPGDLIIVHAGGRGSTRGSTRAAIDSVQKLQQRTGHLTLLVPNGMDLDTLPEEGARKLYEKLHARFGAPTISLDGLRLRRAEEGAAEDLRKAPFFRNVFLGVPFAVDPAMPADRVEVRDGAGKVLAGVNIGEEKRAMAREMMLGIERVTFPGPLFGVSLALGLQGLDLGSAFQKANGEVVPIP